jgi:ribonuclease HI
LGTGTNNLGELWGIAMLVQMAKVRIAEHPSKHDALHIFTDSAYSLGCLTKGWKAKGNAALVKAVISLIDSVPAHMTVTIHWVPAHVGVQGNEHADFLVDSGSARSRIRGANIDRATSIATGDFLPLGHLARGNGVT